MLETRLSQGGRRKASLWCGCACADKLGGDPEGLATLQALIAFGFCVNAPVILQRHEIGELLLADRAEEGAGLVAVLVVEQ